MRGVAGLASQPGWCLGKRLQMRLRLSLGLWVAVPPRFSLISRLAQGARHGGHVLGPPGGSTGRYAAGLRYSQPHAELATVHVSDCLGRFEATASVEKRLRCRAKPSEVLRLPRFYLGDHSLPMSVAAAVMSSSRLQPHPRQAPAFASPVYPICPVPPPNSS